MMNKHKFKNLIEVQDFLRAATLDSDRRKKLLVEIGKTHPHFVGKRMWCKMLGIEYIQPKDYRPLSEGHIITREL